MTIEEIVKSKNFCAYPFVQTSTVPAGFLRPCCFYTDVLKNDDGSKANVATNGFENVWNNSNFREIRRKMLNGEKVKDCAQCHREEESGSESMRIRSLREWSWRPEFLKDVKAAMTTGGRMDSPVRFLELKPGNLCNLKCRMCNQYDSSAFAAELQQIGAKFKGIVEGGQARLFDDSSFDIDFDLTKMADWKNNPSIWDSFEKLIPGLEVISLAGGEPTLIEEVYVALKKCVDSGHSQRITVYFASNFTQKMTRFLELAKSFKRFDFIASIDGFGPAQEYLRFPSKWDTVAQNFREAVAYAEIHPSIVVLANVTVTVYNVTRLDELLGWMDQLEFRKGLKEDPFNLNILMFPEYLSIKNLPDEARAAAIEKLERYRRSSWAAEKSRNVAARLELLISALKNEKASAHLKTVSEFWVFSHILDRHRKQSLQEFDPRLYRSTSGLLTANGLDPETLLNKFL